MKIQFTESFKNTDVIVGILNESNKIPQEIIDLGYDLTGLVTKFIKSDDFKGKFGDHKLFNIILNNKIKHLIIISVGESYELKPHKYQDLGGKIFDIISSNNLDKPMVTCSMQSDKISLIASGLYLKSYNFNKYFTSEKKKKTSLKTAIFLTSDEQSSEESFKEQKSISEAVFQARDLISESPNNLYPESYVEICKKLSKFGIEVEVLDKSKLEELGMNALLGVAQGSVKEPYVVVMKWYGHPNGKSEKPISFIGKGVTFDTGGISLKPSANMDEMKYDMGGSAVVVGTLQSLASRKAKVNAIGVIGLVENMPGGNAQRPGDIVKSMSGQTIEVLNTDAEGRLVLADILHYCKENYDPKFMIDLATLTGAIVVALGAEYAGLFSNDDELSKELIDSGQETGEKLWRMPISSAYDKQIDSKVADMQNIGNAKGAGSITAAQFLKRFVGDVRWAHLDIAGVTWSNKAQPISPRGATAFGVRMLDNLVKKNYE